MALQKPTSRRAPASSLYYLGWYQVTNCSSSPAIFDTPEKDRNIALALLWTIAVFGVCFCSWVGPKRFMFIAASRCGSSSTLRLLHRHRRGPKYTLPGAVGQRPIWTLESFFGGDPPSSPPDAWMRGCVRASIHPSRTPDVHPAGYLMRVHRDRRDPIVLCDVGTPGQSAPLGDDGQVRFAAC
ncbi:hypothetical protein CSAL01_09389 [Colletotrichum salicis]|uniref:Uncharacterized protein n=1 Tax=Colletotrichum salicis TaxID=1209931 RepID=A0A135V1W9_9PEZI|nr:hypothetical protein CSAL01_09389 [Colletotrichum salicis]